MANRFWVGGTGTWDAATTHWSATSGGSAGASVPTAADDVYFDANSGGGTVTVNTSNRVCGSLSFRGLSSTSDYTGTFAQSGTGALFISGGLILSASTTYTYAGAITFNGITGFNITSNSVTWPGSNITISGSNLNLSCTDAFATTGIFTMTQGNIAGSTISVGGLTITSNALTRTINFTSMSFTGAGVLATIGATQTNLTFTVSDFYITGAQASARSLATTGVFYPTNVYLAGSGSGNTAFTSSSSTFVYCNIIVTNTGGSTINLLTGLYNNITFQSGTNAVWGNAVSQTLTCIGNITFTSTQGTPTLTPAIILNGAAGNPQTITSAGKSFVTGVITINDVGNAVAYTFADAFSSNAAVTITATGIGGSVNINANFNLTLVTNILTLTAGTLNVNNGANITCGLVSCLNAGLRTINMGSGTWTITGTGTPWNFATATNTTLNAQQSRILINDTSTATLSFAGGGFTYYTVEFARGASTAIIGLSGSNTFANFIDNTSTVAHTYSITSGSTQTFYKFNVKGSSASARITLARSSTTNVNLVKVGQGVVCNSDYLIVSSVTACTPSTGVWYAGSNSTGAPAGGWIAGNALSSQSLLGAGGVG